MAETSFPATTDRPSATQLQALTRGVDNEGKLPASGAFPGQRVWLADVKGWAVWDGVNRWITDTGWLTVGVDSSYATGWGSGYENSAYCRRSGFVTVAVSANRDDASAANSIIFALPPGFWPSRTLRSDASRSAGTAAAEVAIDSSGSVVCVNARGGTEHISALLTFPVAL